MSTNVRIEVRERGKLIARRDSHNVWTQSGGRWLSQLVSYGSFSPPAFEGNSRIASVGFGIGGINQTAPVVANVDPMSTHYPGTNLQSDVDVRNTRLERPVRISWTTGAPTVPTGSYPTLTYDPGDVFRQVYAAPPDHPDTRSVRYTFSFSPGDIADGTTFLVVPLSEIGLYSRDAGIGDYAPTLLSYDTFETLPLTASMTLLLTWTLRV